ncbi:hypothetical protein CDAR_201051 [Caerostris darwini]|uniref:Uncharacterized protein n=1 Tax=Caerostris darwini TaxID=1538125 RepID=A0AAV4P5L0_9ARAC|nr:hypothetical protein CDAR_201051 [Caerostris darwini]
MLFTSTKHRTWSPSPRRRNDRIAVFFSRSRVHTRTGGLLPKYPVALSPWPMNPEANSTQVADRNKNSVSNELTFRKFTRFTVGKRGPEKENL